MEISAPSYLTDAILGVLEPDGMVSSLSVMRGASVRPAGDVIVADIPREDANDILDRLRAIGVHAEGSIHVQAVQTWMSRPAFEAERQAPGAGADAVVWADVVQRAYEDSELTWTFLSFMTLATLIAGIAIILDSQILVIGAMVLGPEFGAIAALGLALVRRRRRLFTQALRTLAIGFAVAIALTTLVSLAGRALGWVTVVDLLEPRPGTAFIYTPDRWSFVVALIAGAAGVLSMTSAKSGGLVGVFISVTTIPAAGNVALGLAFGVWPEVWGSTWQLVVNITGMAAAGWATLTFQQAVWRRVASRRRLRTTAADHPSG